jgi:hypothetical protein
MDILGGIKDWASGVVGDIGNLFGSDAPAAPPPPEQAPAPTPAPNPEASSNAANAHQADPTAQAVADRAQAKVADNTPVFQNGNLDGPQFLQQLSQFDNDPLTMDDPRRCGATSAMAVAVANGGKEGLGKLINHLAEAHPDDPDIQNAKAKFDAGTLNYGDLGKLGSAMNAYYSKDDGMHGPELGKLLRDAGITPPSGRNPGEFPNGTSWPMMIDTDRDGTANHWVVVGKDAEGKAYIYDPWPKPGQSQVAREGSDEFNRLLGQVRAGGSGSGFAARGA